MGGRGAEELRDAIPELPDELGDRQADAWEPLLAIADLAGGDWGDRARSAAIELSATADGDEIGRGTQLLVGIRGALDGREVITTAELLEAINADDELPFGADDGPLMGQSPPDSAGFQRTQPD